LKLFFHTFTRRSLLEALTSNSSQAIVRKQRRSHCSHQSLQPGYPIRSHLPSSQYNATMSYNKHRRETLRRLGIEQLPRMRPTDEVSRRHFPLRGAVPIRTMPVGLPSLPAHEISNADTCKQVPGKRCPACQSRGQTIWVIPGKRCPQCGHEVN